MTSLEHESNDTSVSASDYGNDMASDYGNDGWDVAGDMDVCIHRFISIEISKQVRFFYFLPFHFVSDITRPKQPIGEFAVD